MTMSRRNLLLFAAGFGVCAAARIAQAQAYPI